MNKLLEAATEVPKKANKLIDFVKDNTVLTGLIVVVILLVISTIILYRRTKKEKKGRR